MPVTENALRPAAATAGAMNNPLNRVKEWRGPTNSSCVPGFCRVGYLGTHPTEHCAPGAQIEGKSRYRGAIAYRLGACYCGSKNPRILWALPRALIQGIPIPDSNPEEVVTVAKAYCATTQVRTLSDVLAVGIPEAPAILAPGREPLGFDGLRDQVERVGQNLAAVGIGRSDRVAIVLPNGPEMSTLFLGVATYAVAAPLNPALREPEFDFYLGDLDASLLILAENYETPALKVAEARGIPVMHLNVPESAPAGVIELRGISDDACAAPTPSGPDDFALVLHTSGTTSRPKIVPLTQQNLVASAMHIAVSLELSCRDRCLSVMPQFHIHGLIAGTLAPLYSGGSVSCTPGFDALRFFRWLESERPTWYTAVPTMHQAILARGVRQSEKAKQTGLRFIRSSSASLPPSVFEQLGELFGCPVIESYGMTEATHQMTANPLPPSPQKAGTVGLPAGPRVRIADAESRFLAIGEEGEIVISGPNVTPGYAGNEEANASAFFNDEDNNRWFRTGDLGRFGEDGYLQITGRIKEIINRGGEKIAPREVDDVLMEYPGVAQAVTFAVAHARLGEDIAAAVVGHEGAIPDEATLKDFLRARLADFKVPQTILVVDEIPKGPTGKLQRIGLARHLGLESAGRDNQ